MIGDGKVSALVPFASQVVPVGGGLPYIVQQWGYAIHITFRAPGGDVEQEHYDLMKNLPIGLN